MKTAKLWQVEATKHFDTRFSQVLAKPPNFPVKLWGLVKKQKLRKDTEKRKKLCQLY